VQRVGGKGTGTAMRNWEGMFLHLHPQTCHRDLAPLGHIRIWDWAHPSNICTKTALTPATLNPGPGALVATPASGRGSPLQHLHRQRAARRPLVLPARGLVPRHRASAGHFARLLRKSVGSRTDSAERPSGCGLCGGAVGADVGRRLADHLPPDRLPRLVGRRQRRRRAFDQADAAR
jgi:hypothetical protein